jgi:hypothetical protein
LLSLLQIIPILLSPLIKLLPLGSAHRLKLAAALLLLCQL